MAVTFVVGPADRGTPEADWRAFGALDGLAAWDPGLPGRVVVVAPHPDDEVLGVGGTMTVLDGLGWVVAVVAVTDGEVAAPGAVRRAESAEAMRRLSLGHVPLVRLGFSDGAVAAAEDELAARLGPLLDGAALCLAPWRGDRHPDHEAAGRAAATACRRAGAALIEYPVWAWHWARPGDGAVPWERARRVDHHAAKADAAQAFTSQLDAILPPPVLARLCRPFEVLFV